VFAGQLTEPLEAFLVEAYTETVPNKFGNFNNVMKMKKEDGSEFELVAVGTLSYVVKNILMASGKMPVNPAVKPETVAKDAALLGKMIRITKTGSYKQKNTGKDVTSFEIEVDPTRTLGATVDSAADTNNIPF